VDLKNIVVGVIVGAIVSGGVLYFALSNKVTKLETEIEHLKSTRIEKPPVTSPEPLREQGPLTKLNMNKAKDMGSIELTPTFHIEWDKGPASKVFQVYKDGVMVKEERVRNGANISLDNNVRGQCEFKTWWDDGTRNREEVWVYVVDA
jgi:hypothetical protein